MKDLPMQKILIAEDHADIRKLLRAQPLQTEGGTTHLPWIRHPSPVFLAASHPKALAAAGTHADGVFINYGLAADNVRESDAIVTGAMQAAGRRPEEVEIWQIAALDCNDDGELAREKIGAMLAFVSGYVIGAKDLDKRGVPEQYREPLLELRRRYSTRPGDADIRLVRELGLFDYLSRRLSICGTPAECREQMLAAKAAGVKRLMFTISLAADPVKTVELFAQHVFPAIR